MKLQKFLKYLHFYNATLIKYTPEINLNNYIPKDMIAIFYIIEFNINLPTN